MCIYLFTYLLPRVFYFSFCVAVPHISQLPARHMHDVLSLCSLASSQHLLPAAFFNSRRNNQLYVHHALRHALPELYIRFMKFIGSHPKRNIASPLQTRDAQIFQRSGSDHQILGARRASQAIRRHPAAFIGVGDLAREFVHSRRRPALRLCVWRQSLCCDSHKPLVMNRNCMPLAQWRAFFRSRLTVMHLYRAFLLWHFSAYSCRAEGHNERCALL